MKLLDVTLRDGSYAIDYQFTPERVGQIVSALDRAGVPYIEVGHGCGLGARESLGLPAAASDLEYVQAARQAAPRAAIGVIAGPPRVTSTELIDQVAEHLDFMRFAANIDSLDLIAEPIAHAKQHDLQIFCQMMRSTRLPIERIVAAARQAEDMGVDAVYLVDTTGHFMPDEVTAIVTELKSVLGIGVGMHTHNNLNLAIANSLAAVAAGCDFVDASLRGMGRGAGNAQLEVLVSLLRRQGLASGVDLDLLLDAGERLVAPLMPPRAGISAVDVATADVNIDIYPVPFYERVAQATGVDLRAFVRELAAIPDYVEVEFVQIRAAITALGGDADAIFAQLGVRVPD